MRSRLFAIFFTGLVLASLPCQAQVPLKHTGSAAPASEDGFDPQTIKPINWDLLKLPKRMQFGPTAEDYKAIEKYRLVINRYYSEGKYIEAEPFYKGYISVLEKVHADKTRLHSAWLNYAELLRRIGREADASAAETKAQGYAATESDATAYALKDFKLGMSLDEFTRLPLPVSKDGPVKVVCSCDAKQKLENLSEEDRLAGIVVCGFWIANGEQANWTAYKMSVAGQNVSPDFRFIKDKDAYRLFEITTSFFASNFDDVKKAFLSKYGQPYADKTEKKRTETGNVFGETIVEWDNGVSKIRLRNIDGTNFDRARLRYVHRMLYLRYANALKAPEEQKTKNAASDL